MVEISLNHVIKDLTEHVNDSYTFNIIINVYVNDILIIDFNKFEIKKIKNHLNKIF